MTRCECGISTSPPPSNSAPKRRSTYSTIVTASDPEAARDGSVAAGGALLNCMGLSSTRSRVKTTLVEAADPHPDLLDATYGACVQVCGSFGSNGMNTATSCKTSPLQFGRPASTCRTSMTPSTSGTMMSSHAASTEDT